MFQQNVALHPQEATKILLSFLPTKRMRDVIEKRFGLKKGTSYTLDAIGKEYQVTRERVRQIEADALKHLRKDESLVGVRPLLESVESQIKHHGNVMAEEHLFTSLVDKKYHPHLALVLGVFDSLHRAPEDEYVRDRWAVNKEAVAVSAEILTGVVRELEQKKQLVSREELERMVAEHGRAIVGSTPENHVVQALLATTKRIQKNPYGEYGVSSWPSINPRGIKDKAYMVLVKKGKPMHFQEVASAINKVGWSKKKAHPQTVHNELIKDGRFVLVGRGLYGLKDWGYEPGAVRDVLVSVFKQAGRPLTKDEVIQLVMEKRLVKIPTVLLNLQNKSLFRRDSGGKYALV